jgi:hypothetical protein
MTNPFTKPALTGYNPSPASDTGAAGGSSNIVRWAKHTDELTDPLRDWVQSIADAVEDAFEGMFGTSNVDMLFVQAAAPTGWTQRTTINDRVLRMVSGTGAGTGGSWTISGISVNDHTLSTSEIRSH